MAREKKSEKDRKILAFCKKYMKEHGYPPSYREIGDACGFKSTSTVNENILRLKDKGEIISDAPFRSSRAFCLKGAKYVFDDEQPEC